MRHPLLAHSQLLAHRCGGSQAFSLEETFYQRFNTHAVAAAAIRRKQAILGSAAAGVSFGMAFYALALICCNPPRSEAKVKPKS